jgi:hypothetical protein
MIPLVVIVFAIGVVRSVRQTRRFRGSGDFPSLSSHDDPINTWTPSVKNGEGHHRGHHGIFGGHGPGSGHDGGHGHGGGWSGGGHDGGGSGGGHHG